MPPGHSQLFTIQMGGAVARVPEDATAVGGRSMAFQTLFIGIWEDAKDRPATVQWVREFWSGLSPKSRGAYVNLSGNMDESVLRDGKEHIDPYRNALKGGWWMAARNRWRY